MDKRVVKLSDILNLENKLSEPQYNAGSLGARHGSKGSVRESIRDAKAYFGNLVPEDEEVAARLEDLQKRVAHVQSKAKEYAPSPEVKGNLKSLNESGVSKVAATTEIGKELEKQYGKISGSDFSKLQGQQGTMTPVVGKAASEIMDLSGARLSALRKLAGKAKGGGKIAAIGAALAAAGSAAAGEPVDSATILEGAANAAIPLPLDLLMPEKVSELPLSNEEIAANRAEMNQQSDEAEKKKEMRRQLLEEMKNRDMSVLTQEDIAKYSK